MNFKNIYSLAVEPKGRVIDSYDGDGNSWNLDLRRNLNDWEFDELGRLLVLLNGIRPSPSLCDSWEWSLSKKGKFTTKSLYLEWGSFRVMSFPQNNN